MSGTTLLVFAPAGDAGRGAGGRVIVLGVFKRGGRVYPDGWGGHDGPVDVGYASHLRVSHAAGGFARGRSPVKGTESFRAYAKGRLTPLRSHAL